jgi:hypothetical protein
MKKLACQYAIVQFMPFIETGEFANIGVVMMEPKEGYFGYKLQTKRVKRITQFFEDLDANVFRNATNELKVELDRVHNTLKAHGFDRRLKTNNVGFATGLFAEVLRPRETIIRFSQPRAVLADNPKEALKQLYDFYVERDFVTKEYRETVLEKGVRNLLLNAQVAQSFHKERIGDSEFGVQFPFVEFDNQLPIKIIKPLNLGQVDSTRILEHGGKWEFRIRELKKRNVFPEQALFAVEGPTGDRRRENAYDEVVEMLTGTGVTVLPFTERNQIVKFAMNP